MARTLITTQNAARNPGNDVSAVLGGAGNVDTANGNYVANDGNVKVLLKTGGTGDTFTVQLAGAANNVDGLSPTAPTYVLAANKSVWAGPFPLSVYGAQLQISATVAGSIILPLA